MLMKVIHIFEVDANKVKISPWKSKQHNLEVLKYIRGVKYLEAEVGKYVFVVMEGKYREGRQYVSIQLSVAHYTTCDDYYTTLKGRWIKKGDKHLKLLNSNCVDPLWFGWLGRSTW